MRKALLAGISAISLASPVLAQEAAPAIEAAPALSQAPATDALIVLKQDTPVELMATSEITTANVTAGTRFKLRVNKPVMVADKIIVPIGSWAYGEVTAAKESGGLGKSGTMTAQVRSLKLGDVEIPLEGDVKAKGTGAGSAGVAILLSGWAALFHRGNNAKIKAGELVTAFVGEDVTLDLANGQVRKVAAPAGSSAPVEPSTGSPQ